MLCVYFLCYKSSAYYAMVSYFVGFMRFLCVQMYVTLHLCVFLVLFLWFFVCLFGSNGVLLLLIFFLMRKGCGFGELERKGGYGWS